MTATELLRALLDERGVEWWQKKRHTCWKVGKGQEVEMWRAWEAPDGSLTLKVDYIYDLTPEQAVAATLGPGTCGMQRFESGTNMTRYGWRCTECGMASIGFGRPRYCPNCGRRCVV